MKKNHLNFILVILVILLIICIYFIWYIINLNDLSDKYVSKNRLVIESSTSFPTFIYNLLINSSRSRNGSVAFDKRSFSNNNWERLKQDIKLRIINVLIIAGRPYFIKKYSEDNSYIYLQTNSLCSTFPLHSCTGYENRNPLLINVTALDVQDLLTQYVHVLGVKL